MRITVILSADFARRISLGLIALNQGRFFAALRMTIKELFGNLFGRAAASVRQYGFSR
jgi:hypothetical protein